MKKGILFAGMILTTMTSCAASDEPDMVLVKGGTFQMGSPATEAERETDEVLHSVTVGDFYMAAREVSQGDYEAVMGTTPSEHKGSDLSVENVTWYDAVAYCNALSQRQGLTPCYTVGEGSVTWNRSADGFRLPTEAEWEYAARGGMQTPFSFGDYVYDTNANCYNAYGYNNDATGHWVNGYLRRTVETDKYDANAFGLKNMHGNVAEWTWDWYDAYEPSAQANPTGRQEGWFKVVRGGGWNDFPKHIRSAYRSAFPADVPLYATGIRLVRNAVAGTGETKSDFAGHANKATGKVLIAYFSQTGNTDGLARIIQEETGYDLFRIERSTPYSATYNSQGLYAEALTEQRENAVPDLKAYVPNIADYDIILLGYCNWWASIPAPVRTFLMHDDFSGKTIVPFCSMGGGRFGQSISAIAKLAPQSIILQGLDVEYTDYDRSRIRTWLESVKKYQQTGIRNTSVSATECFDVYSLDGQKLLTHAATLDGLKKGTYIVNGEKRIIK